MKRIGQNKNNYSLKNRNKMKRLALLVCLLIGTMAAHAQFEKGKWFVNPSVTGQGGGTDVYTLGVGGRYYISKVGVFLGAGVDLNRYDWDGGDKTRFGFGMEAGYAFFLSRTVTIEPAVYWDIDKDRSEFGLKVGFGFYF